MPIPELSLPEFIVSNPYQVAAERLIYIDGNGDRTMTFQGYCEGIQAIASGTKQHFPEISPGDVVGILSTNTFDYPVVTLGISGCGAVPFMVNPSATATEMCYSFKLVAPTGFKALFCHPSLLPTALEALGLAGYSQAELPGIVSMVEEGAPSGQLTVQDLLRSGRRFAAPLTKLARPSKDTLALIFFSSGTTGPSKGVMLSHGNLVANAKQYVAGNQRQFHKDAVFQSFLPLYHLYGTCVAGIVCPVIGMTTVMMEKFDFVLYLECIQKHRTTYCWIVPPVAVLLAKNPIVDNYDTSSLEVLSIAAAPTSLELVSQLRSRLGVKVIQGYGMTESSPAITLLEPKDEAHNGSVGPLVPDMESKIIGQNGEELGIGEEGELIFRGPNVMMGYIRNEKATQETIKDGWLHTGDVGLRTAEGLYFITDRIKELIKVRGFQVAPASLEGVLLSCPLVLDCAVTSIYDEDKATEFPRAFVVVEAEHRDNPQVLKEIREYVDSRVTHYSRLVGGVFALDEIPKSASGKILRRLLPKHVEPVKSKL